MPMTRRAETIKTESVAHQMPAHCRERRLTGRAGWSIQIHPSTGEVPRKQVAILDGIRGFRPSSDLRSGWNGLAALVEEADFGNVLFVNTVV
jgi:hypothetical protein